MFPQRDSEEIVEWMNTVLGLLETVSRIPTGAEQQAAVARMAEFHERLGRVVLREAAASLRHMRAA
jgi:hypothetical protein